MNRSEEFGSAHRSTDRTLSVLEYVAKSKDGRTFTEIVDHLAAPKSSIHPILRTLCDRGFLGYSSGSRRYRTGIKAFECGYSYLEQIDIIDLIRDQMSHIVGVCSEICHFGVLEGGDVLYLLKIDSPEPIRLYSSVGRRLPAYATGIGKALLADYTEPMLQRLYPDGLVSMTPNTITSFSELARQTAAIRESNLAYESEESNLYVRCVATPVRKNGKVIAALSIAVPLFRWTDEKQGLFNLLLLNAKAKIERIIADRDVDFYHM